MLRLSINRSCPAIADVLFALNELDLQMFIFTFD